MKSSWENAALKPYRHQSEGSLWLAEREEALLLDERGLGKTATAILAADLIGARSVLFLAPSVALWNTAREVALWSPGRCAQVVASRRDLPLRPDADVVVASHGLTLSPEVRSAIRARARWSLLVVDELHKFRNPGSQRAEHVFGVHPDERAARPSDLVTRRCSSVLAQSARCWALSGTPNPNGYLSELWVPLRALFPDRIPNELGEPLSYPSFQQRYCLLRPRLRGAPRVVGNRNVAEFRERIRGVALRRLKRDCLDLPPIRYEMVALRPEVLDEGLAEVYRILPPRARDAVAALGDEASADDALAVLRNNTAYGHYRRLCGLAKARAAAELVASELDADPGAKRVLVYYHRDVGDVLREELDVWFGTVRISGAESPAAKQAAVDEFQHGTDRVCLLQVEAGGVAVTLTAASEVDFVEMSFVPGDNVQAADRLHRIGQREPVRARFLGLAGTADEHVVSVLRRKAEMVRETAL